MIAALVLAGICFVCGFCVSRDLVPHFIVWASEEVSYRLHNWLIQLIASRLRLDLKRIMREEK